MTGKLTNALFEAITQNDAVELRGLINRGANVHARWFDDETPLIYASGLGNREIVAVLLQHGAKVSAAEFHGKTALMLAAAHGREQIASLLLQSGADPNEQNPGREPFLGWRPLTHAASQNQVGCARILLAAGAAVNGQDRYGRTPLMHAVEKGHIKMVEYLIQNGADLNIKGDDGETALDIATNWGFQNIVDLLLSCR